MDANGTPGDTPGTAIGLTGPARIVADARDELEAVERAKRDLEGQAVALRRIIEEGERALAGMSHSPDAGLEPVPMSAGLEVRPAQPASVSLDKTQLSPESVHPGGLERYGKIALPAIERAVREHGPQKVERLYRALPEELRAELERSTSAYDPVYRVRRLLRKSPRFIVAKDGTVSLSPAALARDNGKATRILRLVRDQAGEPIGFEIDAGAGATVMKSDDVKNAIRSGMLFWLPPVRGRSSRLTLFDGKFRSEHEGVHNRDFNVLPSVRKNDLDQRLQALL
jgi:hypothetical protein